MDFRRGKGLSGTAWARYLSARSIGALLGVLLFFGALLFCAGCSPAARDPAAQIDALMQPYQGSVPGAGVLVVRDGLPIFRHAYGFANLEARVAATPAANYRLASLTKQFTAASILLLAEEGRLTLADPVRKWLPSLPAAANDITLRHLLTHTSGLIDYEDLMADGTTRQLHDADVLRLLEAENRTYFVPGTAYRYSNSGYALLALIVARASGSDFASFLRDRIFRPLHMQNTVAFEEGISSVADRAYGYSLVNNAWQRTDQSLTSAVLGDGGIYSSIDDLAKWDAALYDNRLLRPESLRQAFTPQTKTDDPAVQYGFGWRITGESLWHSGETMGFRNVIVRFPAHRLTVVVLTNRDDSDPYFLALAIAKIYLPTADATHAAHSVVGPDSAAHPQKNADPKPATP
jgi:CubicO group peptidase (beta-lactamase class C family)